VLCAIDWCEICNEDHLLWRQHLAEAATTLPERVAVHCVHQHDAPLTDLVAQRLHRQYHITPDLMDEAFCYLAMERVGDALRQALLRATPVTHIRVGQAPVAQVASNRRVPGADGRIRIRFSRCFDPELRAEPEGTIDPFLKTLSFWNGNEKLAVLHYYAVHPMSYYGDGFVSADFVGRAREQRSQEDGGVPHVYFTGCAGNITAGKYNDGPPDSYHYFAQRIYRAMREAEKDSVEVIPDRLQWLTQTVKLSPRRDKSEEELMRIVSDSSQSKGQRTIAALWVSFIRRCAKRIPCILSALHLSEQVCLLHLPGEAFVEYQLYAQAQRPGAFIAVASYGDLGMSYIPLEHSFQEVGGYEETWAFAHPRTEAVLKQAIRRLVTAS
jgi:hypothetical protein